MDSPALPLPTPATALCSLRPLSHQLLPPLVPMVHPLHDNQVGSERRLVKVYHRRRKSPPIEEPAAAAAVAVAAEPLDETSPEEGSSGSCEERACAECSTSHTPLWRNGPAGPKVHFCFCSVNSTFLVLFSVISWVSRGFIHVTYLQCLDSFYGYVMGFKHRPRIGRFRTRRGRGAAGDGPAGGGCYGGRRRLEKSARLG